jgi:hypothetical protein
MSEYLSKGAQIDASGTYRFRLWREWRLHPLPAKWDMWTNEIGDPVVDGAGEQIGDPLSCVFVMLNPSTADGEQDDPTIRRCVGFAKRFGFDRLEVVNLFGFRATSPAELLNISPEVDPCGHENQRAVMQALDKAGMIICAWGAHGGHLDQDETMLGWIERFNDRDAPVVSLGVTAKGFPRHPLYLRADAEPRIYDGRPR